MKHNLSPQFEGSKCPAVFSNVPFQNKWHKASCGPSKDIRHSPKMDKRYLDMTSHGWNWCRNFCFICIQYTDTINVCFQTWGDPCLSQSFPHQWPKTWMNGKKTKTRLGCSRIACRIGFRMPKKFISFISSLRPARSPSMDGFRTQSEAKTMFLDMFWHKQNTSSNFCHFLGWHCHHLPSR